MNSVNAMMRIDPWLGIANRNVDVYDTLISHGVPNRKN